SLEGLRYTMQSVLKMHERQDRLFARKSEEGPRYIRDLGGFRRGCMHCHQVKEAIHGDLKRKGKWDKEVVWRYPLPENLGSALEVTRGNVVKEVKEKTPGAVVGLKPGDVVQQLNGLPVHSFADAQYALDLTPKAGAVEVVWKRGEQELKDRL